MSARKLAACPSTYLLITAIALVSVQAKAHDKWADGSSIPKWIKESCCGPADAHQLGPGDYWIDAEGFHIKDIDDVVPLTRVLPSQDGAVWAFWNPDAGRRAVAYCIFYSGGV